jgi:hypothetical protein
LHPSPDWFASQPFEPGALSVKQKSKKPSQDGFFVGGTANAAVWKM